MSSSPAIEASTPTATPSSPALRAPDYQFHTSTPNYLKKQHQPLSVVLTATAPSTPPIYGEPTLTPPPRSPGAPLVTPASGDVRVHGPPDGTSSDKCEIKKKKRDYRGHPGLNRGPLDLQSNALPLSYIPAS
ncbi:jg19025 [Pararge aegeria aegeria]|uniref:Jg19025 protein n=1 Tax=Pararge aegeria aegeria TaxID=348720 RepID=A0A8S4R7Y1_9NEOP|nr:jg19025 [Pararge aegeria aegeria]